MSLTVAELNTRLTADTRNLETGLRRAKSDVSAFGAQGGAAMKAFGGAIAGVVASEGFRALGDFLADAVLGASHLAESANKVGVAFGQATPQVTAWASSLSSAFGATSQEALDAASGFQLVTREAGLTSEQITDLAERAFDLGSQWDRTAAEVSTAIQAGLVGEFEPLRRFGVILNQDKLEAEALAQGLIGPKEEMSAGTKQAVIYSQIMKQTAVAQGDAENTAESAAGQMRQLRANVDDLKVSVGAALLPAFTNLTNFLNASVIPGFTKLLDVIGKNVVTALHLAQGPLRALGGVLDAVGADGFAEDVRGVVGTMDDWRLAMHGLDESFFDLKDDLVDTNAAGGALNNTAGSLSTGLDKVGTSAKDAADAAADLKDALFAVKDAGFALEDAVLAAAEAQDAYNELLATGGVDADKVARATEDVADAQESLNDALAAAGERILRDVESATNDLTKANEKLADQTQNVADAEAKLSKLKAQKKARDEAIKNAKAQLASADTVTERIIAQDALDAALGMEIVTDQELAAAQSNVTTETGKLETATEGVTQASRDLLAAQAQQPTQFDSVKDATERLETAQKGLNTAQQQSPTFAKDVAAAQRDVESANYAVETATWAAEKAQRAYNQALNAQPGHITTTVTRNEIVNETRNINVNATVQSLTGLGTGGGVGIGGGQGLIMLPAFHSGGVVPGPRGADVPIMAQAGETVVPADGGGGMGGGLTVIVEGSVITERDLGRVVADAIRNNGLYGVN